MAGGRRRLGSCTRSPIFPSGEYPTLADILVLVLSGDAMVAALLGTLLELEGFHAVFPARDEPALAALERWMPAIALVDCDHPEACGPEFLSAAESRGVRPVLFSPGRRDYEIEEIARTRKLRAFSLPIERRELGMKLRKAIDPD